MNKGGRNIYNVCGRNNMNRSKRMSRNARKVRRSVREDTNNGL